MQVFIALCPYNFVILMVIGLGLTEYQHTSFSPMNSTSVPAMVTTGACSYVWSVQWYRFQLSATEAQRLQKILLYQTFSYVFQLLQWCARNTCVMDRLKVRWRKRTTIVIFSPQCMKSQWRNHYNHFKTIGHKLWNISKMWNYEMIHILIHKWLIMCLLTNWGLMMHICVNITYKAHIYVSVQHTNIGNQNRTTWSTDTETYSTVVN